MIQVKNEAGVQSPSRAVAPAEAPDGARRQSGEAKGHRRFPPGV